MGKKIKICLAVLAVAAGAGCGGGGGGASPSTGSATTPPPVVVVPPPEVSTIVTTVQAVTYPAGSQELIAFERLNAERLGCGFGSLKQNLALDKAALAHANWLTANGGLNHFERAATPFFSGVTPLDRVLAAGYETYSGAVTEESVGNYNNQVIGMGELGIRLLLNGPYHMVGLMAGFREVGFSHRTAANNQLQFPFQALTINPAFKAVDGFQLLAPTELMTYPCEGSTGILPNLRAELPNPVPGRDLGIKPLGTSVVVAIREGRNLKIVTASITNLVTGVPAVVRPAIDAQNDPNATTAGVYFRPNQAVITADSPLAPMTKHQVVITGTNNSTPFSRTFIFTTGETEF